MNAAASIPAPDRLAGGGHDGELAELVGRLGSDDAAWATLVGRFDGMLRTIARSFRLAPADVDDAVQVTWTLLHQHSHRLRDPGAVGSWLATTIRREALRLLQAHVREILSDDPELGDDVLQGRPDIELIAAEQRVVLGRALASLPDRQRQLMTLLAHDPNADYRQISAALAMPIGSIGPIRARGLARLERHPELRRHYLTAC